jgi:hypothetical protein
VLFISCSPERDSRSPPWHAGTSHARRAAGSSASVSCTVGEQKVNGCGVRDDRPRSSNEEEVDTMTEMIREIRGTTRPAVLAWVPVTGADGRVRMEMRWQLSTPAGAARKVA